MDYNKLRAHAKTTLKRKHEDIRMQNNARMKAARYRNIAPKLCLIIPETKEGYVRDILLRLDDVPMGMKNDARNRMIEYYNSCNYIGVVKTCDKLRTAYSVGHEMLHYLEYMTIVCYILIGNINDAISYSLNAWSDVVKYYDCFSSKSVTPKSFHYIMCCKMAVSEICSNHGYRKEAQYHLLDIMQAVMGDESYKNFSKHTYFGSTYERLDPPFIRNNSHKLFFYDSASHGMSYLCSSYENISECNSIFYNTEKAVQDKRTRHRNTMYQHRFSTSEYQNCSIDISSLNVFRPGHRNVISNYINLMEGFILDEDVNDVSDDNSCSDGDDDNDESDVDECSTTVATCTAKSKEEYFQQRCNAFYNEVRSRSILYICPCCGEENSSIKFSKAVVVNESICTLLPVQTYCDCNSILGSSASHRSKINLMRLLEPIRKNNNTPVAGSCEVAINCYSFVTHLEVTSKSIRLCKKCYSCLKKGTVPFFSFKNFPIMKPTPELLGLSNIETTLISRILPLVSIYKTVRKGVHTKKFSINFRTGYVNIAKQLPHLEDSVTISVSVNVETDEDGKIIEKMVDGKKHRPYPVRRTVVENALKWLIARNPLYNDVVIDVSSLNNLPEKASEHDDVTVEERLHNDDDCVTTDNNIPLEDEIIRVINGGTGASPINSREETICIDNKYFRTVRTVDGHCVSVIEALSYFVQLETTKIRELIFEYIESCINEDLVLQNLMSCDIMYWESEMIRDVEIQDSCANLLSIFNVRKLTPIQMCTLYLDIMSEIIDPDDVNNKIVTWYDNGAVIEYVLTKILHVDLIIHCSKDCSVSHGRNITTKDVSTKAVSILCKGPGRYLPIVPINTNNGTGYSVITEGGKSNIYLFPCKDIVSLSSTKHFTELAWPCLFPDARGGPQFLTTEGTSNYKTNTVVCEGTCDSSTLKKYFRHLMRFYTRQFQNNVKFAFWCRSEMFKNSIQGVASSASIQRSALDRHNAQFLPTDTIMLNAGHLRELKSKNDSLLSALRPFFNSMALKGSSVYWEENRKDLLSMLGSENMPNSCATFFQTLSSSDRCWPELFHMIDPTLVTIDGVWKREISISEREELLSKNAGIAATHFFDRFEAYVKHVLTHKSVFNDIGDVTDHWFRFEFQARGSVHGHGILFSSRFQNSSEEMKSEEGIELLRKRLESVVFAEGNYAYCKYNTSYDKDVSCCVDCVGGYCSCDTIHEQPSRYNSVFEHPSCKIINPKLLSDPEILFHVNELIKVLQTHRCCFTCWKYNNKMTEECTCRFKFPKILSDIFDIIVEEYIDKVTGSKRYKHTVIYKRKSTVDAHINPYHPLTLFCWKANMDLQFIGNPYGACVYACKYCSKNEAAEQIVLTSSLLKRIKQLQIEDLSREVQLRKELSIMLYSSLGAREVGVQETMWILLGHPLVVKTRQVIKINGLPPFKRLKKLKTIKELGELDDTDTNIFKNGPSSQDAIIRCYENRPDNTTELSRLGCGTNHTFIRPVDISEDRGLEHLAKINAIDFDTMSFSTFVSVFQITKSKLKTKICFRVYVDKHEYYISFRKRRPVIRLSPYIRININDEDSAFSIMFLHTPFRSENDILGIVDLEGNYTVSAVELLKEKIRLNQFPNVISESLKRQMLVQEVSADVYDTNDGGEQYRNTHNRNSSRTPVNYTFDDDDEIDANNMLYGLSSVSESNQLNAEDDLLLPHHTVKPITGSIFADNTSFIRKYNAARNVKFRDVTTIFYEDAVLSKRQKKHENLGVAIHINTRPNENVNQPNVYRPPTDEVISKLIFVLRTINRGQLTFIEACVTSLERDETINFFLSGQGGTGKSYLIAILELIFAFISTRLRGCNAPVAKTSFTGSAASQISGTHIHAMFHLRMRENGNIVRMTLEDKSKLIKEFTDVLLLVIDEVSMLSLKLLLVVNDRLQKVYGNTKPFGGIHVIFSGDYYQLSVLGSDPLYAQNAVSQIMRIINRYLNLTEQLRTSNIPFATALSFLRLGPPSQLTQEACDNTYAPVRGHVPTNFAESLALVNSRVISRDNGLLDNVQTFGAARWSTVNNYNSVASERNSRCNDSIVIYAQHYLQSASVLINGKNTLRSKERESLSQWFVKKNAHVRDEDYGTDSNIDYTKLLPYIRIAKGDRLMITQNIMQEINITNGATGVVTHLLYDKEYDIKDICMSLKDAARCSVPPPIPILLLRLDNYDGPGYEGIPHVVPIYPVTMVFNYSIAGTTATERIVRTMLPVMHAWCCTIHKLQGCSCKSIAVDPTGMFARGQAYVGISRAMCFDNFYVIGQKFQLKLFKYGEEERKKIEKEYKRLEKIGVGKLHANIDISLEERELDGGVVGIRASEHYIHNLISRLLVIRERNWKRTNINENKM